MREKFPDLCEKFHGRVVNCILRFHGNMLKNFLFEKKIFFHQFRTISEKFPDFCEKFHCRVLKTAFYVSMATY